MRGYVSPAAWRGNASRVGCAKQREEERELVGEREWEGEGGKPDLGPGLGLWLGLGLLLPWERYMAAEAAVAVGVGAVLGRLLPRLPV